MKLGSLEKKILVALLEKRKGCYPKQGNNTEGIARLIWGESAFVDVWSGLSMKDSVRATLTRALNNLYKKKLVIKGKPIYEGRWYRKDEFPDWVGNDSGDYGREFKGLDLQEYNNERTIITRSDLKQWENGLPMPVSLPSRTKFWWMLTEEGREKALRIDNPNYDEELKKKQFEEKCLQRCKTCVHFIDCELIPLKQHLVEHCERYVEGENY